MPLQPADRVWRIRASDLLKTELHKAQVSYKELAELLKGYGFQESVGSISQKLLRGSFSAAFMLAVLAVLDAENVMRLSKGPEAN